ncbi:MAG: glycosyltransferase involved in cell wall biosynthesis [Flavobacteriales bacterium]|jgi:glycosyltransferase involved in cell wall biosynthesis
MVSVIVTTFNYASYVERALRSVVDQSLSSDQYEILVINDASTDHTAEILENWEEHIRVFNLKDNIGLAGARNFGIKKARGQYVIFVDADDYVHSDLLKVQKLFLDQNNSIDAVSTDYFVVSEKGKHLEHVNAEEKPVACGIMFRKDYLYQIGLYDEGFRAREEEDLRIRWISKYNIHNVIIPLYRYWMHDTNLTKNDEEMDKFQKKLAQKHD